MNFLRGAARLLGLEERSELRQLGRPLARLFLVSSDSKQNAKCIELSCGQLHLFIVNISADKSQK